MDKIEAMSTDPDGLRLETEYRYNFDRYNNIISIYFISERWEVLETSHPTKTGMWLKEKLMKKLMSNAVNFLIRKFNLIS